MKIDAHQHFWVYDPEQHVWMTDAMGVLKTDYLPEALNPLLGHIGFDGTVAVQARQVLEETEWLLELADHHSAIKGVVGWVDLRSPRVDEQLERFASHPKLVGVRHVVHDEPDDRFMSRPEFQRGVARLQEFGLCYDLLLFPRHIPIAVQLAQRFPGQPFVLDHIGKPAIADGTTSPWEDDLSALAACDNVFCKASGMVTEANWQHWNAADFHRYLDIVFDAFGAERVMIGSDWPVCTLAGSYGEVMQIVIDYVESLTSEERAGVLGDNCARFYQLTDADAS